MVVVLSRVCLMVNSIGVMDSFAVEKFSLLKTFFNIQDCQYLVCCWQQEAKGNLFSAAAYWKASKIDPIGCF